MRIHSVVFASWILMGGAMSVSALGFLPPPQPPAAPANFSVQVNPYGVAASWTNDPKANSVTFTMDGGVAQATGPEYPGSLFIPQTIDISKSHQFSLVAYAQMGGQTAASAPAYFNYQPPAPPSSVTIPVVLTDTRSDGPEVRGDVMIEPNYSVTNRAQASFTVNPGETRTGTIQSPQAGDYAVYVGGWLNGSGVFNCSGSPVIIRTSDGQWPGQTVTVTFAGSGQDSSQITCNLSVQ